MIEGASAFGVDFFDWYNNEHHHSGIALLTPETVHYGLAQEVSRNRNDKRTPSACGAQCLRAQWYIYYPRPCSAKPSVKMHPLLIAKRLTLLSVHQQIG